ncbi:amidohydrolase family protein [Streptomyces sp. NPDC057460]|uniref:amidohydrolase family protein n=1 Tax=Streptomyces sp. NPDC057460 TaxID=3346141 RepID=UPI00367471E0
MPWTSIRPARSAGGGVWCTPRVWGCGSGIVDALGPSGCWSYPPACLYRRPSRDLTQPPHGSDQALTALEALQGMTLNAALTAGEEHQAGRIAVGHRADLTVFADDPLTIAATDLPDLPVLLTVLDGHPTHRDPSM